MIESLAALLSAAATLKRLPRSGWLVAGLDRAESVADHSFGVVLLALALADAMNVDPAAHGLERPLNVERVLRIAILHDLAESEVTDLPKRSADWLGRDNKHRAEGDAFAALALGYPAAAEWVANHAEYDGGASPEALLVRDADKLEMVHQAVVYRAAGATNLAEFLAAPPYSFGLSSALHAHLLARW